MDVFEIEDCLKSMTIIVDSREQPSERAQRRYNAFSVPYNRQTLNYGDYTYNFTLPSKKCLYEPNTTVKGYCVIERKMDLAELSNCFTRERKRFASEFDRAKENGASIYLLVENASWENLINGKYKTQFNPKSFMASITAWMVRYDLKVIFCKEETTGRMIQEILYRDLKERLERGEFDERRDK